MTRFPTADERWPRAGKIMTKRVFLIGNGTSRKDFDLTPLKNMVKYMVVMPYGEKN